MIIKNISSAKKTILVQAYSFTDKEIIEALSQAKRNGVDVQVILDKSNRTDRYSQLKNLKKENISYKIDEPSGIAHNKIIIIDSNRVIGGSYNFSNAAYKKNTENVLIISDKKLAHEYTKNWKYRWSISATE